MQGCTGNSDGDDPARGIALELAQLRAASLGDVRYAYSLEIPADATLPIAGRATIRFTRAADEAPLVLDFAPGASHVDAVRANGRPATFRAVNGHLVLAPAALVAGENAVDVEFRAGDAALNRSDDFMYSLFVPARAHHALPLFDQPDLKARFSLELTVPAAWRAVSNGAERSRQAMDDAVRIAYAETAPIPSYLFAFAAGRFEIETVERAGREYRMLHRETDAAKVARNRDEIIDLHAAALDWLERYTGIPYPFGKFDFVLIPSFQFNGMEHPGAIYYRDSSLLLDESATENDRLDRARVIAHETAHMWFGDLVTMRWFDDVWMKEVFANFMAAKIADPSFPEVDHDLRFMVSHHPLAYSVDRTTGTHAIRQPLGNLDAAGSLYGPIIYQKAPIVMRQLERLTGPERFRGGLRKYLARFAFGNASWLDLVAALGEETEIDVAAWSRVWIEEAGRPTITTAVERDATGRIERLALVQTDPLQAPVGAASDAPRIWPQQLGVLVATGDDAAHIDVDLAGGSVEIEVPDPLRRATLVLPPADGLAYGAFELDAGSRERLLSELPSLAAPVERGAAWITLWDELLAGRVPPASLIALARAALPRETVTQNIELALEMTAETFWRFLSAEQRAAVAPALESTLRDGLEQASDAGSKAVWFDALRATATTPAGVALLEQAWRERGLPGLPLSEADEAELALELAVRGVGDADRILDAQLTRFGNPDRRARFEFVRPAVAADVAVRDAFFASLAQADRRRREQWVVEGLTYLNHPLRAATAEKHLPAALALLPEIARTGDIFFPKNWTDAVLGGHSSPSAARAVREFLAAHPELQAPLRRIVLQSADDLFRAAAIGTDAAH